MRTHYSAVLWLAIYVCSGAFAFSQQTVAGLGELGAWWKADVSAVKISIPSKSWQQLPNALPLYSIRSPTPFRAQGVEWILFHCITNDAERKQIQGKLSSQPDLLKQGNTILLSTKRDYLLLNPDEGTVNFRLTPDDRYLRSLTTNAPKREAVLARRELEKTITNLFTAFGLDTAELSRKPNGELDYFLSDTERFPKRVPPGIVIDRGMILHREMAGFPVLGFTSSQIEVRRLADGVWREIKMHWPKMLATNSVPLPCRSAAELRGLFEAKRFLWDHNNQFSPADAKNMAVTEIRFAYFEPKGARQLVPLMLLDADVKTTDGKNEYAVLILPIDVPTPWTKQELESVK